MCVYYIYVQKRIRRYIKRLSNVKIDSFGNDWSVTMSDKKIIFDNQTLYHVRYCFQPMARVENVYCTYIFKGYTILT
jgi:hypothetical protein